MSPSSPIPESSIGFSDTWRVRRAAPGTRSGRARHRGPEAIPCHEFQRRPLEHSVNLDPKLRTLHVCPTGAPNVARIRWGERIFQKRGSLNLLSGPQNRVSLPNKVGNSAGLSRLSVALEIECPIVHLTQIPATCRDRHRVRIRGDGVTCRQGWKRLLPPFRPAIAHKRNGADWPSRRRDGARSRNKHVLREA